MIFFFFTTPNRPKLDTLKIHYGGELYKDDDDVLSYSGGEITSVD